MGNGDALCAFNGTGYTLDGTHVKIPETAICDDLIPPDPEDEVNTVTHMLTLGTAKIPPPLTDHQLSPTTVSRNGTNATVCSNPWPACTTCMPTRETTTAPATTTLTNLPTDPSGRPYSVVSEIMSAGTESGQGQETASKGVVLVEPSSRVTCTTGAGNGGSSTAFDRSGLVSVVVAGMVWFLVLGGLG